MSTSEKFCVKWNDFQEKNNTAFVALRKDVEFTDVTLACEDGNQVEAHKVVLAASSPFFYNLLKRNKHIHPLIYMTGLKFEDLLAIVDFFYYGETNIYQENLDNFLNIAEELELKGLNGGDGGSEEKEDPTNHTGKPTVMRSAPKKNENLHHPRNQKTSYESYNNDENSSKTMMTLPKDEFS